jgi:hypothetical protein
MKAGKSGKVIQLSDYREPKPVRTKVLPFHKKYPMPFFKRRKRGGINAWSVVPTGIYSVDCETGAGYAIEFLKSCDGTYGWLSLLPAIVADMIEAAPREETWPNGKPKTNGIVIGFMSVISKAAALSSPYAEQLREELR